MDTKFDKDYWSKKVVPKFPFNAIADSMFSIFLIKIHITPSAPVQGAEMAVLIIILENICQDGNIGHT